MSIVSLMSFFTLTIVLNIVNFSMHKTFDYQVSPERLALDIASSMTKMCNIIFGSSMLIIFGLYYLGIITIRN